MLLVIEGIVGQCPASDDVTLLSCSSEPFAKGAVRRIKKRPWLLFEKPFEHLEKSVGVIGVGDESQQSR